MTAATQLVRSVRMLPRFTARSALDLIGNTPLAELPGLGPNPAVRIFAKLEWFNPGGSVKDRPARQMVLDALESGALRSGMTVLEATSGNTGTAMAYVCRVLGFPVRLVIPEATSTPKRIDMARFGAELVLVPGHTTDQALEIAYRMREAEPDRLFMPDQYTSPSNPRAHYLTTGPEILRQCPSVTHVVAAQGSFGTLGGIARRMAESRPEVEVHAVVSRPGSRSLFGIKEAQQVMPLVDNTVLSGRIMVGGSESVDGIEAALAFGYQLGPSAGAVLAGALRLAARLKAANIVCVFADSGSKYPDCPLYLKNWRESVSDDQVDHESFTRW